jgi:C-terminal processing protease CtpA/Prc
MENDVVYLRVGHVTGNLANELTAAYRALTASNKVAGTVLDLRFVVGDDAASAQAAANLFASKKIAAGSLVVLVNAETRGAAEMLAAALRHAGAGLIIGNPTAGEAATFKEFPLRNGERLRIAVTPGQITAKAGDSRPGSGARGGFDQRPGVVRESRP